MRRNRKKGITLTEICVVLAVLSIISVAVVSFAAMATGRSATGSDKLKFMQDIALLEATVDDWFNAVYTGNKSVKATADGSRSWLEEEGDAGVYFRCFSQNLTAVFPGGVTRNLQFEAITGVEFAVEGSDSDEIFFCTVTYVYRQGQNKEVEKTYTFCVNPHVGESVSE